MLVLLLALVAQTAPPSDEDAIDVTPGRCIAAADRLDIAVRLARDMLDGKNAAGADRTQTEARVAHAQAVAAAIRARFPKVVATDDDRDDVSGGDVLPFAEQCLSAKLSKGK
jgi:hypothetical protein